MNDTGRKVNLNMLWAAFVFLLASCAIPVTSGQGHQFSSGEKARIIGTILTRDGDLIRLRDKKSGDVVVVGIKEDTRIERKKHSVVFFRHEDMDVTAMAPGLKIEAEAVGNPKRRRFRSRRMSSRRSSRGTAGARQQDRSAEYTG